MDELSYADIVQQYQNNLVNYFGEAVFVSRVFEDKRLKVFNISTRLSDVVPFKREHFSVIKQRLGMVNIHDSVVYISRIPVRKMGIGLNSNNLNIGMLATKYPQGKDEAVHAIRSLIHEGISKTLKGEFPTLKQAIALVLSEKPSTVAFDRQFAVNSDLMIFYKTRCVGAVGFDATTPSSILFSEEYKHLSILLENNHEKTVGYSCP